MTKRNHRLAAALLALLLLVGLLAGCGGGGNPSTEAPPQSHPVTGGETTPSVGEKPSDPGAEPSDTPAKPSDTGADPSDTPTEEQPPANPQETPAQPPEGSSFSIHFIDVGQADAALVTCDGHSMLIDGGNVADSNVIYSVLKKAGIDRLDVVVGTHAHEDHIGGLPGAFQYAAADLTLCPVTTYDSKAFRNFAKDAGERGGGITVPHAGYFFDLGSARVTVVGVNGGEDTNDTSIVLKIVYGETSFLFTGDAEREAEQAILNSGFDLSATVLKVGHHGSSTSTSYLFLREVMPEYAVISVGKGNEYGHPTEEVLSRLRDADVTTFRTDLQGDVYCTSDGKRVTFTVDRNKDANTLAPAVSDTPAGSPEPSEEPEPLQEPEPTPEPSPEPEGTDYVLNTNSMKFHYPDCHSAKKIKEENRAEYTGTREELLAKGYSPCGNCDP